MNENRILYFQTPSMEKTPVGAEVQTGSGLTDEAKQALLDCFNHVAWDDDNGLNYYNSLHDALYPPENVASISAVFAQGQNIIHDTDSLNTLRQYLTVTATFEDQATQTVTAYTLSGTLAVGTSTVTVSYGGKTTTFTVTVTAAPADLIYNEPLVMQATNTTSATWDSTTGIGTITYLVNHYPAIVSNGLLYKYLDVSDKTLRFSCSVTLAGVPSVDDGLIVEIAQFNSQNPDDITSDVSSRYGVITTNQNSAQTITLEKRVDELFTTPDGGAYLGFIICLHSSGGSATISNIVAEVV